MHGLSVSLVCAGVLASVVCDAAAQTPRPDRPYRGLFGGRVDNPETLLTLQTSAGVGYDTNVLFENAGLGGGTNDPRVGVSSTFSSLAASLNFTRNGSRYSLGASAGTTLRHYANLVNNWVPAHSGSIGATFNFTESSRITGSQTVAYQQFLSLMSLPQLYDAELGLESVADIDGGTGRQGYVSYGSNVEWSQTLTRRATLSFGLYRHLSDFGEQAEVGDFLTTTASGRFLYGIGRGLGARIGYGYHEATYSNGEGSNYSGSTLDAGLDFNRALSLSRRTTLTFATGSTASHYEDVTYYRFLGNARLNREFGRSWNAALAYDRTVELQPAYPEPVLGDAATFGVSGLLNRRTQFTSSIGAFFGSVGFAGAGNGFETYTAGAGVTIGITRYIGLNATYAYYKYRYDEGAVPPWLEGLPSQTDRHSIQANLVVWTPLIYRARKADATR